MTLLEEITTDPAGMGYAALLPDSPGRVADLLNAPTASMVKSRFVTARTILAECEDGAAVLDALSAAAQVNSAVKWALTFLSQNSGIDVGHPRTQAMIDGLAQAGALSLNLAAQLKALGVQPASRAELLGLGSVTIDDLIAAGVIQ